MGGPETGDRTRLGLWSGVGLVAANMIGTGVFLSTGFMAQEMGPGLVLTSWLVGTALALAGARAYAEVARQVPRSGGEYRYLSVLLHPLAGYLAGWTSLLVGFSAPVAVAAVAAGHFLRTLVPAVHPQLVAAVLIVSLTAAHAAGMSLSKRTQNGLVAVKAALLASFVAVGLARAPIAWPAWAPPHPPEGSSLPAFMTSLFFVAFAFSGWNAAAYAAEEFREPRRDVPRAMVLGCALVGALYLAVNWVFVTSLTPERAAVVLAYESDRVTLGHLIMQDALGPLGAQAMSAITVVAFVSSMSAMIFVGPRVYASMARDGYLPRVLAGGSGPPAGSIVLQGALALALVFTHRLQQMLVNLGAILTLFAGLTALSLFRLSWTAERKERPAAVALWAAGVYGLSAAWMLYFGFRARTHLAAWMVAVAAVAAVSYLFMRPGRRPSPP